jgi:hypothetical protein
MAAATSSTTRTRSWGSIQRLPIDPNTSTITFDHNRGHVLVYAQVFSDRLRANIATGFNHGASVEAADNRTLREPFFNLTYSPVKHTTSAPNGSTASAARSPARPHVVE